MANNNTTNEGNETMTKTQKISQLILAEIADGKSPQEALDSVCGAGTAEKLVSDLYDTFQQRRNRELMFGKNDEAFPSDSEWSSIVD